MSRLEVRARPHVTALMHGTPQSLAPADAATLGRWGAKTALMFQALEQPSDRVVPRELYEPLRRAKFLPATFRVWAGRVEAVGVFQHAFSGDLAHGVRKARMFTSLVAFDRLAIMVMGSTDSGLLQALQMSHLANAWIELRGDRSLIWPSAFTFDTTNFMAMPQLLEQLVTIPPRTRL